MNVLMEHFRATTISKGAASLRALLLFCRLQKRSIDLKGEDQLQFLFGDSLCLLLDASGRFSDFTKVFQETFHHPFEKVGSEKVDSWPWSFWDSIRSIYNLSFFHIIHDHPQSFIQHPKSSKVYVSFTHHHHHHHPFHPHPHPRHPSLYLFATPIIAAQGFKISLGTWQISSPTVLLSAPVRHPRIKGTVGSLAVGKMQPWPFTG